MGNLEVKSAAQTSPCANEPIPEPLFWWKPQLIPRCILQFLHTHLSSLFQLSEHHNRAAPPLPDHPPEVFYGVHEGPLTRYVGVFLTVTLWLTREKQKGIKMSRVGRISSNSEDVKQVFLKHSHQWRRRWRSLCSPLLVWLEWLLC